MRLPVGAPEQRQFHQLILLRRPSERFGRSCGQRAEPLPTRLFSLFKLGILGLAFATAKS